MSDGSLGTFTKIRNLLRTDLSATQFVGLCQAYGFDGITNAWLSRTLKSGKLNHDTDVLLRPLVLKVEDLIERAKPFPVSFADPEGTKLLLDIIGLGVDLSVGTPIKINSSEEVTTNLSGNIPTDGGETLNPI